MKPASIAIISSFVFMACACVGLSVSLWSTADKLGTGEESQGLTRAIQSYQFGIVWYSLMAIGYTTFAAYATFVQQALTSKVHTALTSSGIVMTNVLVALCGIIGDPNNLDFLESSLAFTILMMLGVVAFVAVLFAYQKDLVCDSNPAPIKEEKKDVQMTGFEYARGTTDKVTDESAVVDLSLPVKSIVPRP